MRNYRFRHCPAHIGLLLSLLIGVILTSHFTIQAETAVSPTEPSATSSNVIILFTPLPAARQKTELATGLSELSTAQQDDLRRYGRFLTTTHQQFLQNLHQMGINAHLNHDFTYLLNGIAITLNSSDVNRLAGLPGVRDVFPDSTVHLNLEDSVPLIGADQVWQMTDNQQRSITGQGIRVAIIDTGIDYTHPDLGGCFGTGCKVVDGYDLYNNDADPLDDNGHGTHCAGVVAADGTMTGVAPGASLIAYKVLDANGAGTISGIISGIERAADPDQDPATADAVDIISMSLGYPGTPGDPWSLAVEAAAAQGILVVVAAGNNGPDYSTLDSPGLNPHAFAVGASDKSDQIASFSSRGPLPGYPDLIKPDIVAPGNDIISTWLSGGYASANGTSMATPHVAGAAALVWQAHPSWTAEMVQANLMNTAVHLDANVYTQGAGRVQVDKAVQETAVVTPGTLGLGMVTVNQPQWSASRTFWITNTATTSQNYTFSVTGPLLENEAALVTAVLSTEQLTLSSGQGAAVTLTLTLVPSRIPPDLDRNEGRIQIQSEGTLLTLPFAWQMPPIFADSRVLPFAVQTSYDVALGDLDGDGDLDAFVGNTTYYDNPANTVWLNDGQGIFVDSGQRLGSSFTQAIALGDLDKDGDLDAFVINGDVWDPQPNNVWVNNGHGTFTDSGQSLGNEVSRGVALGDLDGDGDLDAFVANGDPSYGGGEPNSVWINNGSGLFSIGQSLGASVSQNVALGDLDGDGDLDAFVVNGNPERSRSEANDVWLNNGHGTFTDSGQRLGASISQDVVLGDLDSDGDLDAFVANGGPEWADGQPDRLWLNNGSAMFVDSGQLLGSQSSYGTALGDLHADGVLDLFVAGYHGGNKVWLNDGHANLTLSDPGFATESAAAVALGDVDGDGDVDALVANAIGRENRLWLNRGSGLETTTWPVGPTNLTATAVSVDQINLSWNDNAADETSYRIERSPDGSTNWTEIANLAANSTTYSDTGLTCEPPYHYRVRAYRAGDTLYSDYSNLAQATTFGCPTALPTPTGLVATAVSANQINLSWNDNAADETSYRIERSPDGSTNWTEIANLAANSTTYSDTGLTCETTYHYRVRAYRAGDTLYSDYSNLAQATTSGYPTALPTPTGLVATAVAANQINLSWNDNAADETSYLVEQLSEGNVTWIEIASLSANATTYQDTGLTSDTTYQYRIRAYRAGDNLYSAYSNIAQAKTDWLLYLPIILRP